MDFSQYPTTRQEAVLQKSKYYFTGAPCIHGHIALRKAKGTCLDCLKIEWQKTTAERKGKPKSAAAKLAGIKYYEKNKELVKMRAASRSPEDRKQYKKTWKANHPDKVLASTNDRRRRHKNARPCWITAEQLRQIRQYYVDAITVTKVTGVQYVVDHIIPLRSHEVCGLHVPWNLRVITQEENLKKSNKLES